jgi:hypothetical protein
MSAVIRLLRQGKPLVLLPGDIDEVGLQNVLESGTDISAEIVIFPHHGGGASSGSLSGFASSFCKASRPEKLLFSIGRGKYDTPKPEVIAAAVEEMPKVRILCTQLSEHCASQLPTGDPGHLTGKVSKGKESRRCCAGSISVSLEDKETTVFPILEAHTEFIGRAAPSALCMKGRAKP